MSANPGTIHTVTKTSVKGEINKMNINSYVKCQFSNNEQNTGAAGTTRPTLTTPSIHIQRVGKLPNTHEYIHGPTQLVRGEHNEEHTNTQLGTGNTKGKDNGNDEYLITEHSTQHSVDVS